MSKNKDLKKHNQGAQQKQLLSLHPLDPDEALEAFLDTPPPEDEQGNKNRKRGADKKKDTEEE